jgi:hypothetical protein
MPALDLALGHRVTGRATDVLHVLPVEPFCQVRRDVAGAIVGEKPWPVDDLCLVESRGLQCQVQRGGDILARIRRMRRAFISILGRFSYNNQ